MLAARDEDLRAAHAVGAVVTRRCLCGDLAKVRAALRLREAHGAGKLAAHQRRQPRVLELLVAVGEDRIYGALGQPWEHEPRPVRCRDHLRLHKCERHRQALTAILLREGEPLPAALGEDIIRLLEAGWRLDGGGVDARATLFVCGRIHRSQLICA